MLYGIKFWSDDWSLHSNDLGLILTKKNIGTPEPQLTLVEVPGRDGVLDLTDSPVRFKNRNIRLDFAMVDKNSNFTVIFSKVQNLLHGKKVRITLDEDENFYYEGRCRVNALESSTVIGKIVIELDANPHKLDIMGAGEDWLWNPFSFEDGIIYPSMVEVAGEKTINLPNRQKQVIPTFTCTSNMTAEFEGQQFDFKQGENMVSDILLKEGDNKITFKGNGTVTVKYRGGSL